MAPFNNSTASAGPWRSTSNPVIQAVGGLVLIILGGMALWLSSPHDDVTTRAAFVLGVVMLMAGAATLLLRGQEVITVDPKAAQIVIERRNRLRTRARTIAFKDIAGIDLGEQGDLEGGSVRYHVQVRLKSGRSVALFHGFFDGAHSQHAMDARRARLDAYLAGYTRATTPP